MYRKLVAVYEGERVLGEAELHPSDCFVLGNELKEIRISHYSPPSERCPPLAVLHTISATGICFKLESTAKNQDSPLSLLHAACLRDNKALIWKVGYLEKILSFLKTREQLWIQSYLNFSASKMAIVVIFCLLFKLVLQTAVASVGGGEIHLVAMHSRKYEGQCPCFWGFNVASSLYNSCLVMLNLRCLGIVFDLDETLIVANTMRSFEDRIEALQRKINSESDPQRVAGMLAEAKRYQDDKSILKQYAESDQVIDNGKVVRSQSEVVPALSETHQPIVRPLIRLQDRNIILTRINPLIRDTSVLVRELLDRIVCVKSGLRKSLFNVFQAGNCHPKMALVIDDRLKVWDEKDQPRVHVVPAFAPYYAPQAEANNTVPVLCVARNVACNVRGGFFKEFDDGLLPRISGVAYEDDTRDVPSSPDVSNYLISEDDPSASTGNKDSLGFDGMADAEVERRLKEATSASSTSSLPIPNLDPRIAPALHYAVPSSSFTIPPQTIQGSAMSFPGQQLSQVTTLLKPPLAQLGQSETTLQSSPAREEGEVPESELDPDTRRRLLILQHGQDMREHPPSESQFPARPSTQVSVPRVQPRGWFPVEEEMSPRQLNRVPPPNAESLPIDKNRAHHPPFLHKVEPLSLPVEFLKARGHRRSSALLLYIYNFEGEDGSVNQPSSANKDLDLEAGQIDPYTETCTGTLQDIAFKCGTKVEFKQALVSSTELQFFVEVLFAGERIGEGVGRTRREAQRQAAEGSLFCLADKYLSQLRPDSSHVTGDGSRFANQKDNGVLSDASSFGHQSMLKEEVVPFSAAQTPRILDPRIEASKKPMGSIAALKELCMTEGLGVAFQTQPQFSANLGQKNEVYAQVEINGQVLGKGIGLTWDEAKSEAAEKALGALKSMLGQFPYRHQGSPRSAQGMPNKRVKQEFSRVPQRMPSSGRYPKNGSPVP
ncbi:UNVERIFIED_CONTAM: RNA polymerase II C-terminal domain phosphatase-like 1 [Sesamum angustifolium]|uniref:RNA polymerase II C-terminal domain phosphatase-like 1 n=1 Tax=Sesamum angustifolium TaxID=2727405 RepID=A0AAW2PA00_9LAMI